MELGGLLEQLEDPDPVIRRSAIGKFTYLSDTDVPSAMLDRLMQDSDTRVREFTLEYLQWCRPANHTDYLLSALDDVELSVRWKAIRHLGRYPDGRAAPRLQELLNEEVEQTEYRYHVISALGACDDGNNAPLLFSLVKDPTTTNSDTGVALGKVAKADMIDAIVELLQAESPAVVEAAVWALGEAGDPSVVPELIECMTRYENDGRLRRTIIWALQKLPNRVAIDVLLETTKDQRPYVRWEAIHALKSYPEPRVIKILVGYLVDKDEHIRASAINALKNIPDMTNALLDGLKREKNTRLMTVFARVLGERGDKKAIPLLESKLAASSDKLLNSELRKALDALKP